jgi:hypothetical protein
LSADHQAGNQCRSDDGDNNVSSQAGGHAVSRARRLVPARRSA